MCPKMDPGLPGGPPGGPPGGLLGGLPGLCPPASPDGPLSGLKNECTFPVNVLARVRAAAVVTVCVAIERLWVCSLAVEL
jgi:hypothetical protein